VGRVDVEVNSLQQANIGFDNLLLGSEESSIRSVAVANFANAKGRCPDKDWNIFIPDSSETLQGIVDGNCSFENAEYRCKITANVDANSCTNGGASDDDVVVLNGGIKILNAATSGMVRVGY